ATPRITCCWTHPSSASPAPAGWRRSVGERRSTSIPTSGRACTRSWRKESPCCQHTTAEKSRRSGEEPVEDTRVLVARIRVREVLDLTVDEPGPCHRQRLARELRRRDRKHPVEHAVDEVDRPVF